MREKRDILRETFRPLSSVPAYIAEHHPYHGEIHLQTALRWATEDDPQKRLETIKVGSKRFTSDEAIDDCIKRRIELQNPPDSPAKSIKKKRVAKAKRKLARQLR